MVFKITHVIHIAVRLGEEGRESEGEGETQREGERERKRERERETQREREEERGRKKEREKERGKEKREGTQSFTGSQGNSDQNPFRETQHKPTERHSSQHQCEIPKILTKREAMLQIALNNQ